MKLSIVSTLPCSANRAGGFLGHCPPQPRHATVEGIVSDPRTDARLTSEGIGAVFHYVPLHDSPAGRRYGRTNGNLTVTNDVASRLIRLPMWVGLQEVDQSRVVEALTRILTLRA